MSERVTAGERPGLARRLLAWYALTVVALLSVLGIVINEQTSELLLEELTERLIEEGQTVRFALEGSNDLQRDAIALGERIGTRITLISTDGTVLADSARDPSEMENHADRPEVLTALVGEVGLDSRLSETVGVSFRYVALPVEGGVIYRLSVPLTDIDESLSRVRFAIVGSALVVVLLGVGVVWLVARRIARPLVEITGTVAAIADGDLAARMPRADLAEFERLARAVDRMADELERRILEAGEASELRDRVLSTLDEAVMLIERGGKVVYANEPARRLFDHPTDLRRLAPPAMHDAVVEAFASAARQSGEFSRGHPSVEYSVAAIPIDTGEMVVVVVGDITEARRVEAMRRDLVADASHELKTPVAAISAGAETILRAVEDGDIAAVTRFANQIERNSGRLGRLVSDLLDLSRLESERPELEPILVDQLVSDEVHIAGVEAEDRSIALSVRTEPIAVSGSRHDLSLAVRNLLANALRYTQRNGSVEIGVRLEGDRAVIEVTDTGLGIPTRDLPRIFERFYRVDAARSRETGGTGLGLAIVKHVVEGHGGSVEVESELGRGSKFTIRLPALDLC